MIAGQAAVVYEKVFVYTRGGLYRGVCNTVVYAMDGFDLTIIISIFVFIVIFIKFGFLLRVLL